MRTARPRPKLIPAANVARTATRRKRRRHAAVPNLSRAPCAVPDGDVVLTVADTGGGIAAD